MPDMKIVGRGVDTLVLNVCYADKLFQPMKQELVEDMQLELNRLQSTARLNEAPVITRWTFKGINLYMQEKGSRGQWRWILKSPHLSVAISRGRLSCIIAQVRLSSEYLWSCEYLAEAIIEVGLFLYGMFGDYLWFQVSEVDLCTDVIGWDVSQANWQECFISRAISDDGRPLDDSFLVDGPDVVRRRWKRIETLDFGKHTSPVSCCIYHKTAEIRQKSPTKVWFHDLWRVEFRLTREFLHAASIEAAEDLPDHIQALWKYCAGRSGAADGLPDGWLRYVTPTKDTNRARWPVHSAWAAIQGAFLQEDDGLGPIVRVRKREKNIERGLAFCHWLEREELLHKPITTRFRLPRVEEKFKPTFTSQDIQKLLDACEEGDRNRPQLRKALTARNRAIVSLFIDTGIRLNELVGLHLGDIDRTMRVLLVHRKGNKWQQVPVSRDGFKPLHDYLMKFRPYLAMQAGVDTARKEDAVFLNDDGEPLAYWGVAALWRRLKKRTGIGDKRVSAHNARRYMATTQLADGRSPLDVQRQMGHTTLHMTNKYASLTIDHLKKSHERHSPLRIDNSGSTETFGTGYWNE